MRWYSPWEGYRTSQKSKGTPPPYQSLLALLKSIPALDDPESIKRLGKAPKSLTSSDEGKILDWCCRFGLLGIMPHTAIGIQLPSSPSAHGDQEQREYVRMNGKWIGDFLVGSVTLFDLVEAFREMFLRAQSRKGSPRDLRDLENLVRRTYPVPKMFFRDLDGPTLKATPVARILGKFFPDFKHRGNQFVCPVPLTEEFWGVYSERVYDFLKVALAFRSAVVPTSGHHDSESLTRLEWFLEPIGMSLSLDSNNAVQEQWVCPSLLSSFGRMALQDISAGMRVLCCECCGSPFVTSSYQARYCSQTCAWRHRKRRARTPKADAAMEAQLNAKTKTRQ